MDVEPGTLEGSFVALRRLAKSFDELTESGRPASPARERSLRRLARKLGATAVPTCARQLSSDDDARAEWAYALLAHIAEKTKGRSRVAHALTDIAENRRGGDRAVLRAVALLDTLGEPLPRCAALRDPDAAYGRSVSALRKALADPEEAARIADGLVAGASEDRIAELAGALAKTDPGAAAELVGEILARHDIEGPVRLELSQLASLLPPPRLATAPDVAIRIGRRTGRTVVIALAQTEGDAARALYSLIDGAGRLCRVYYTARITPGRLERDVAGPLEREGYRLRPARPRDAAGVLAHAARNTLAARGTLPRDYYLSRHLLALHREHLLDGDIVGPHERTRVLGRARELSSRGAHTRVRLLLEGLLRHAPRDANARSSLGLALLALGEAASARAEFERAAELEPDQPGHLWNAAAAAHREGRPGACYLALRRFLRRDDVPEPLAGLMAGERKQKARAYIAEYERLAMLEHPGCEVTTVARAEAIFCEARLALARGDHEATISALREVVDQVPTHYGAWTHLGMAQGLCGQPEEARGSLERALSIRPGDRLALDTLRSLDLRSQRPTSAPSLHGASGA